ncbi:DsbA family protein [Caulobacter sp. S45]|uniref:DsbA family protein n=1 Tax=Caulobacter sp. S45 TaxID=1641861 RepID=UPI00157584EE|nr:DsbA family protein [Caulobacter sp. S45]
MLLSHLRSSALLLSTLTALVVPVAACHAEESPADLAFGRRVRAYLLAHPEVLQEAFDQLQAKADAGKAADARSAIVARKQMLERDPRDPVLGNPQGAVTVVEFFDYRCPFCKAAEPDVEKLLAANPDIRLVLKEFPILDAEDQTHISEDAARAALAANAQGRYDVVHRALLAQKHLDEDGITALLKVDGVDPNAAKTVETSTSTTAQIADARALARALGIDGTPAFIVGDQMISGAQMDLLRAAVVRARKAPQR